jgi:hypothetical protein
MFAQTAYVTFFLFKETKAIKEIDFMIQSVEYTIKDLILEIVKRKNPLIEGISIS